MSDSAEEEVGAEGRIRDTGVRRAAATLPKDGDGHGEEARTEQRGNFWLATGASYPVKRRCDADRHGAFVGRPVLFWFWAVPSGTASSLATRS
jgi:hypothetical protein